MEEQQNDLYIVDGNAYIYRSFYAIRDLATSTGFPTNAIYGFVNLIFKILREDKPTYFAIAFDTSAPTFRHREYADYKADRPDMPDPLAQQIPVIREILQALNVPIIELEGYEADDIIGTLAKKAELLGLNVTIVTSDKDAFQLVSPQVRVRPYGFRGAQDRDFIYDEEEVKKRYGVGPQNITDLLGLMGDESDSIPGVPGIGEKTAVELLSQFNSIEDILKNLDKIKSEKRRNILKEYAEQALLSKRLATIDLSVPIEVDFNDLKMDFAPDGCPVNCDRKKLLDIFKRLEFMKFLKEIEVPVDDSDSSKAQYHTILTEAELDELIDRLRNAKEFCLDTETTGLDPMTSDIVGISIAMKPYEAYYIPVMHTYIGAPKQLPLKTVIEKLKPVFEDQTIGKIGQNIKFDLQILKRHGIELKGISFDTMLASYVLNPSSRGHDLSTLAISLLNYKMTPIEELIGKGREQLAMSEVDIQKACRYSCEDADITLRLREIMEPKLVECSLENVFKGIELPLISVLADMEMTGVKVDTQWLSELSKRMEDQLKDLTKEIYALAGEEFNINSTQQLGEILFNKLKLPAGKKTKTGYSTNEAELERLSNLGYELPAKILQYRSIAKLKSTYVDSLPACINPMTGRVHTSFNQAVTETGRLSSSNPNLQNIPIRTEEGKEIRRAFIPGENGYLMLSADYSQIELRILAHLSGDKNLLEAFKNEQDIHASTASLIFGLPIEQISPEMRRKAKTVNFGIIYGISAFGLSNELGIAVSEAQRFIDDYFRLYSDVKSYFNHLIEFAREKGYVTTISGRRRYIPEINSPNKNQREFAERTAINTPVQGSAADLIKMAMIKIHEFLTSERLKTKLLLQVHDELVFETPEDEVDFVSNNIRSLMENAIPLDVPIKVDIGVGSNWLDAKQ